jgi:hypothetical protein
MNMKRLTVWAVAAMVGTVSSLWAGGAAPIQTPEPATMLLLAAGAAGVGVWRWRASKK